jgi:hypothetical protein
VNSVLSNMFLIFILLFFINIKKIDWQILTVIIEFVICIIVESSKMVQTLSELVMVIICFYFLIPIKSYNRCSTVLDIFIIMKRKLEIWKTVKTAAEFRISAVHRTSLTSTIEVMSFYQICLHWLNLLILYISFISI